MANTALIKRPLVTDKTGALSEKGKYAFVVAKNATKSEIKKAVKELYHVDATSVNVINIPTKRKRFRGVLSERGGHRKAIVTLKEGQKIDIN